MKFQDAIEEVRNRINIVDVIGQYVRLKRTGNNYMGVCPFHNEKTPSFSVSESKQIYKCFGCGKGGNVYNFLMEEEGMTFPEALKYLAAKVNVTIEDDYRQNDEYTKKKQELYKLYKDVANAYFLTLYSDDGKQGLEYFNKRKLTKETIKKFGLGYAPKSYGYMFKKMREKGYDDKLLIESRLFGLNDNGAYDFFYERVMFPLVDMSGNVVSFQGRILGDGNQKYINTAESLIYKKSRHLFGVNHAKSTKKDYYILCEGNMDVITLHQAGFDNAVASWGTAFTKEQANLIKKKVRKVILSQDTDSAGIHAIEASSKICADAGIETYVLDLNPVKDADEFIIKFGKEAFEQKLASPIPTFLFLIGTLKKTYNLSNAYDYEKYISAIVERLAGIDNTLVRDKYEKDVALQEGLSLVDIQKSVEKHLQGVKVIPNDINMRTKIGDIHSDNNQNDDVEKLFIHIILENEKIREKIKSYVSLEELSNKSCKYVYEKYLEGKNANQILDMSNLLSEDEAKNVNEAIFGKYEKSFSSAYNDIALILNELIKKIKINNINKNASNDLDKIFENNELINDINNKVYTF